MDTFIVRIHRAPTSDRDLRGTVQRPGNGALTFTSADQLLDLLGTGAAPDRGDGNGAGSTSSSDMRDT